MKNPYVHSNFPRIENDNYHTIDKRCIYAFIQHFQPALSVDICAPDGSGIVNTLIECGYNAFCISDAFIDKLSAEWIVTNPPYSRPLVDNIIMRQLERLDTLEVVGVAMLLRSNFDFAKTRSYIFDHKYYAGQIKMRFRPWWTEKRDKQPIHNYVWQLWTYEAQYNPPIVLYSDGTKKIKETNKSFVYCFTCCSNQIHRFINNKLKCSNCGSDKWID